MPDQVFIDEVDLTAVILDTRTLPHLSKCGLNLDFKRLKELVTNKGQNPIIGGGLMAFGVSLLDRQKNIMAGPPHPVRSALQHTGFLMYHTETMIFENIFKFLKEGKEQTFKKPTPGVDVRIAMHMLANPALIQDVKTFIIISTSVDMVPLIETLRGLYKRIVLLTEYQNKETNKLAIPQAHIIADKVEILSEIDGLCYDKPAPMEQSE